MGKIRGQVKLNRFIFSDHLPLRGVGGLYQEIKSAKINTDFRGGWNYIGDKTTPILVSPIITE